MTEYYERSTNVGGSTSEGISPGRGKVCLRLAQNDGSERVILNLSDVYYLPRSPCNLVSLGRLNNHDIFHNNEHETLYHVKTRKILAHAQRWNNSYLLTPLNVTDSAIQLTKTSEDDTYDCPQTYVHRTSETKLSLTSWHKCLGHFNFPSLRKHLQRLKISFIDDSEKHVCDSCQRGKATKIYNRQNPQERAKFPFEFIYTDLVGPIRPIGFGGERYFFTFTDDFTRYTETYTGAKKSDWFKCLKAFHNLCKTRSNKERPVHRLRSDYGSELQSKRVEEWLKKEGIIFEPSAPYSQEQNGVSELVGRIIMDMTRATILEGNLCDDLWPEIVLAMTYIKNIRPTKALEGNSSPYYAQHQKDPDINHLRILGSTVYVLLHEEERDLKSEKWKARALRGKLVGFDGLTIYRVYIEQQAKVIRIKDLRIFEDYEPKDSTDLPTYEETPTFQGFPADDNDDKEP